MTAEEGNTVRVDFVEMEAHDSELALAIESEFYRFESCVRAGAKRAYREARQRVARNRGLHCHVSPWESFEQTRVRRPTWSRRSHERREER